MVLLAVLVLLCPFVILGCVGVRVLLIQSEKSLSILSTLGSLFPSHTITIPLAVCIRIFIDFQ